MRDISAKNSLLALWTTTPLGGDPDDLLRAWGFTFITEMTWHKVGRKGIGYWLRGDVEKLLIGRRGTVPAWRANQSNYAAANGEALAEAGVLPRVPDGANTACGARRTVRH